MENHSYDNKLGMLRRPDADGFRIGRDGLPRAENPYANGDIQHAFRMPTTCQLSGAPSQTWLDSHTQFDNGRNDGFVVSGSGPVAMGYWEQADQPFYYSLAKVFPIADRYFCSLLGQTYPNRRYLISATSIGMVNDTLPAANRLPGQRDHLRPPRRRRHHLEGLLLHAAHHRAVPGAVLKNAGTKVVPIADFFTDAAAGTLPGFCLVEPNYVTQSEEDPQNIAVGERSPPRSSTPSWPAPAGSAPCWCGPTTSTAGTTTTCRRRRPWRPTASPRTSPPASPPTTASPSTASGCPPRSSRRGHGRGYVSHQIFDHTSICALVEAKWNLAAMTYRDANANPMLDMVDLRRPAFLNPPPLAQPLLDTDPSALACNVSGPGTIPPPGSVSPPRKRP